MKFKIIPAPDRLKEEVECFRIAEYIGEEGLAINVSLNGMPGIVFQHNNGGILLKASSPLQGAISPYPPCMSMDK